MASGAAALSNAELLAVIIRTGTPYEDAIRLAERILVRYDGLYGLAQANIAELHEVIGLGSAKIAQIIAALELSKRLTTAPASEPPTITSAADAAHYVSDMEFLTQEHVRVILLNSARHVVAVPTAYIGTISVTVLRPAEIFREAVRHSSPALILAHNHPSGDPTPSPEDIELTRTLAAAGRLLDITLVDHIIVGRRRWVSLRDQGFLP